MSQFTVRTKSLWQRMMRDRWTGKAEQVPGETYYVMPTTDYASYDADAFVKNQHEFVFDTVPLALADCVAGRMDNIVLLPGIHNVATTSLAMSKAGVKIWGPEAWMDLPVYTPSAILTTDISGDEIMNVTAEDCGVIGVTVRPNFSADAIDLSAAADGFLIDKCHFDLYTPPVNTATVGVTGAAANFVQITNSRFISDGAQGNAIVATALLDALIEDCTFINTGGTWASAVLCGAATDRLHINRCHFLCTGTAMVVGVNGAGATLASGVLVSYCHFGSLVTKGVDGFDAGECELAENYVAGVGSTDGGELILVIT